MSTEHEKQLLNATEQRFVERLATHYLPPPLDAAQRAAFDRALEERVFRRSRFLFFRPITAAAIACAAALLWSGLENYGNINSRDKGQQLTLEKTTKNIAPIKSPSLLTYAYYSSELYGDEDEDDEETADFLPDEYEALASALEG